MLRASSGVTSNSEPTMLMGPELVPDGGFQFVPADGGAHAVHSSPVARSSSQVPSGRSVGISWKASASKPRTSVKAKIPASQAVSTSAPTGAPTTSTSMAPTTVRTHQPTLAPSTSTTKSAFGSELLARKGSHALHAISSVMDGNKSHAEMGEIMIAGSLTLVIALFCCGWVVQRFFRCCRRKNVGNGTACYDEESAHESVKRTTKVSGHEYSFSFQQKPASTTRSGPSPAQACRGCVQEKERLLKPKDEACSSADSQLRKEAACEVERILAAPDQLAVLGGGVRAQRNARFRELARLLHPDKGLVEGDRAALALRRVVEAHRALASQQP